MTLLFKVLRWRGLPWLLAVAFTIGTVVAGAVYAGARSSYHRSQVTQHAAPQMATVVSREFHGSPATTRNTPGSTYNTVRYTTTTVVRLADGTTSTVHQRGLMGPAAPGEQMNVVVDPADRGYAEVPFQPYTKSPTPVLIGIAVFGLIALLLWGNAFRARAARERQAAFTG